MNQYLELLDFWFNKHKNNWFGCSKETDIIISKKYKTMLLNEKPLLDNVINLPYNILLAKIILYDQISRHVFRENKDNIKQYDEIAIKLIELSCILENEDKHYLFTCEERVFLLMPYRHTFESKYLDKCLYFINKWRIESDKPIYNRFYYATIKAIVKINDEKRTKSDLLYIPIKTWNNNEINSIYALKIFDNNKFSKIDIFSIFCQNIPFNYKGNITVSISGGVDSMVSLFLLKKLSIINSEIKPQAIGINYKNRIEQDIEMYMVYKYCKSLNIPFYIREINEIIRTCDKDRQFYEEITRTIRFNAYEKIEGPIILGHNLDDTLENIFCNIKKQKNYNNLFGMDNFSKERNVSIWRPLLSIAKKDIVSYAHENNIPYTYDSTPSWSDRGKMRDNLIPFINNFDNNILEGLVNMCHNFTEIYKIYENSIPEIEYKDDYCIIDNHKEIYFEDYWRKILSIIVKKYGFIFIKNKSIKNMICRIKIGSKERITLSKNMILQMQNNNKILIYINF